MALMRLSLRDIRNRMARTILTLLSVVIGTSAVVAVALSSQTTRLAQSAMFEAMSGKAQLEVVGLGGLAIPETILASVRGIAGVEVAVPSINRSANVVINRKQARSQAIGIDPALDSKIRDYKVVEGRMVEGDSELMIDASFARSVGVQLGNEIRLQSWGGMRDWKIVGIVEPQGGSSIVEGGLLYMTLEAAQSAFRTGRKIDSIKVLVASDQNVEKVREAIANVLPPETKVQSTVRSSSIADQATLATEQGLRLAIAFSLLIAVFIIYNTFQMVVGERRKQLGILRAIGATRWQIHWMILRESFVLGIVGTIIGSLLGIGGAHLLILATEEVLMVQQPRPQMSLWPFVIALLFGVCMSWLGAFVPAKRAGRVSAAEALRESGEGEIEGRPHRMIMIGFLLFAIGSSVLALSVLRVLPATLSIPAAICILIGIVLLIHLVLTPLAKCAQQMIAPFFGVESVLAYRQLIRHRGRTALTTGVLFIAIATGIGLACTILDNVRDVQRWSTRAIVGDFFVRSSMPDLVLGSSASVPEGVTDQIRNLPGVRAIDTMKFVSLRSGTTTVIAIIREFDTAQQVYFDLIEGDAADVLNDIRNGGIVISKVLDERINLKTGDTMNFEAPNGEQGFPIVGMVNDYIAGGLTVYMDRKTARQHFQIEGVDAIIVRSEKGRLADVEQELKAVCEQHGLILQSYRVLIGIIQKMTDGVVGSLWAILALGSSIAAFGLINTLSMNILEQTREIGVLRVVAMLRRQVRRMIISQALIMGTIGLIPGAAAGIMVSYLINISAVASTGRSVPFEFRPGVTAIGLGVGFLVVILASLIPAERASRMQLGDALKYE